MLHFGQPFACKLKLWIRKNKLHKVAGVSLSLFLTRWVVLISQIQREKINALTADFFCWIVLTFKCAQSRWDAVPGHQAAHRDQNKQHTAEGHPVSHPRNYSRSDFTNRLVSTKHPHPVSGFAASPEQIYSNWEIKTRFTLLPSYRLVFSPATVCTKRTERSASTRCKCEAFVFHQ